MHGALDEFVATLRGTGLVDEELSWSGGTAHLVSVGDLLDRGDYGRQAMDLLMRLQAKPLPPVAPCTCCSAITRP
jgi:hypothetical protein